ncbi:hypothetical protein SH2C18_31130 [Clostridium sediminicola]|uniref:hypothetical protein n=1 Tax=Clostridium sediminicola TaxID=3114879 RepID=UPI0031F22F3B
MYIEQIDDETINSEIYQYKNKKPYLEGFYFPYSLMDDHIFEILLYYIFKEDINCKGEYSWQNGCQVYDDVRLMKEGPDEGRDCTLHLNGQAVGVVQCKCYGKDITKPQTAKEIIKFILFYLDRGKDKDLISNINNFTYYLVVAKDFNKEAATLVKGFNKNVLDEDELESWTKQVINKYKTLKCKYDDIKIDLEEILQKIKVRMITEVDLHKMLWTKYQDITKLFFKLKEVHIEDIEFNEALERIYNDIESREISDRVKSSILEKVTEILETFNEKGEKEFSKFINAIKTPFPKLSFGINNRIKYKENIYNLSNIIIHVSIISLTFPNAELQGEIGKGIKLSENKYITYLFSERNESYKTIVLNLIKHIESNHRYQMKGIKDVLVGSTCAKCDITKPGASFDFDGIIKQFTKTEMGDERKEKFTNFRNKYSFEFHCRNCLEFEWQDSIEEIKGILAKTMEGNSCG